MTATVRWDDVEVGTVLPTQTFPIDRAALVRYAGASGDFNPIHWNERFAAYRELVYETPGFADYFFAATPIREIAELNIGSRPAKRPGSGGGEDIAFVALGQIEGGVGRPLCVEGSIHLHHSAGVSRPRSMTSLRGIVTA